MYIDLHELLMEATRKQIDLMESGELKEEMLDKAPPVLWFGNINSNSEKILTIAANPSRSEFLDKDKYYLPLGKERFRALRESEHLRDILTSANLRNEIINSFNSYFENNPYVRWFGKSVEPYNVEGFLRGLNASYYDLSMENSIKYSALHMDLLPFVTKSDFSEILREIRNKNLIQWSRGFLKKLIQVADPKLIIVFGKTNFKIFSEIFHFSIDEIHSSNWKKNNGNTINTSFSTERLFWSTPVVGLSTNLGNPIGFEKGDLQNFGKHIYSELKKRDFV